MKPFDLTRFGKDYEKKYNIISGFSDPKTWIDTGAYVMNKIISGSFFRGVPLDGKVTVFAGESGSGKSYICSGNMVKWCRENDVLVCLLDTEGAIDRSWIKALNVDPDDTAGIVRLPVASPDDVAGCINMFMTQYNETYKGISPDDRQKVLFVLDSVGMLMTKAEQEQFAAADMKGVMGQKAKQLKALVGNCLRLFSGNPVGMVVTNHTYVSSDMFKPGDIVSGGNGFIFASSIVVILSKAKLKTDDNGDKITEVRGIRSKVQVMKSRFSKPFESVEVQIPYDTGMSPFSGLFEYFEKAGKLVKSGNRYEYADANGEIHKLYRKEWMKDHARLMMIMQEWEAQGDIVVGGFGDDLEVLADEVGDE